MALTRDEITAGATYAVRLSGKLSFKRNNDARTMVKGLGRLEDTTSEYDPATGTWHVTLPPDSQRGLSDLRILAHAYDAVVERATDTAAGTPKLTYKRTGQGEWVVFGPASLMQPGLVTVTKKDGTDSTEIIGRLGKPFAVRGTEYCYGYIAQPEPGMRRVRAFGHDFTEYASGFGPDEMA